MREKNWTWLEFFKEGYVVYDVFSLLRDANKALTSTEVAEKIGKKDTKQVSYQLDVLVKRKLIFRSKKKIKLQRGWPGKLYAINKRLLKERAEELSKELRKKPYKFNQSDTLKQKVCEFIKHSDMGYTPLEILDRLGFEEPEHQLKRCAYNTCYKLFKEGHVTISPFRFPNRIKGVSNVGTLIYGRDKEAVWRGIDRLMPDEVRMAVTLIRNTMEVYPSWIIRQRSGICSNDIDQWLKKAFYKVGLVDYRTVGNDSYFFSPQMPEKAVNNAINVFVEERRKWIAKITSLGSLFEKKAIYTFVEYLRAKGEQVETTEDFPEKIPSWLNKESRDANKEEIKGHIHWTNDVWKFNREPLDFVVFSRDKVMGSRKAYIISVKKDFNRSYGVGYFSSFVGCTRMGRTKNGTRIPEFLNSTPVFICGEAWGQNLWKFNNCFTGQAGIILTLKKMRNMIEKAGIHFPEEHIFEDIYERNKAYQAYQNHEDVLLSGKSVLEVMKERGFELRVEEKRQNAFSQPKHKKIKS